LKTWGSCRWLEDKEYLAGILSRRIIEEKREGIFQRAQEAREACKRGEAKSWWLFQDLHKDLRDA
jgi:hypothetical protein